MFEKPADKAVRMAIHFEGWKWKITEQVGGMYRVPFDVKSEDLHERLKNAPVGTRFMLALVQIDDNEQPIEDTTSRIPNSDTSSDDGKGSDSHRRVTKAVLLCQDDEFNAWAVSQGYNNGQEMIYAECEIQSRSEVKNNSTAIMKFEALITSYQFRNYNLN